MSTIASVVTLVCPEPSAFIAKICSLNKLARMLEKRILAPSGDHAGSASSA
jgi:hypothetical protein